MQNFGPWPESRLSDQNANGSMSLMNRRLAVLFVALGVLVVAVYVASAGRSGREERRTQEAAFASAHPGAAGTLVTLDVDGMTCPGCAKSVDEELRKVAGVTACRVDLERHVAEVRLADVDIEPQVLVAAVHDAGYDARIER